MELIIDEPGYTLNFPKIGTIRTPCKLEFSGVNINVIISTLKMNGISRYKIVEDNSNKFRSLPEHSKVIKAKKPEKVIVERVTNTNSIELTKLNRKFDRLMDGLNQLMEKGIERPKPITKTVYIDNKPKIEDIDEDDASFIPEIDLDGFEISSSKSNEIFVDSDVSSSADILRELKGGNKDE